MNIRSNPFGNRSRDSAAASLSSWTGNHSERPSSRIPSSRIATCHGSNFRGSVLSQVKVAKTFNADGRTVSYAAGQAVTCYDCHNGPNGD